MFYTPGIEINAGATLDGDVKIEHSVTSDGVTEMQLGGHNGLYLCLSEDALHALHAATGAAIEAVQRLAAAA